MRTGLRQLENNRAPFDLDGRSGRRGHLRAARRPAHRVSPAAPAGRFGRDQYTGDRVAVLAGAPDPAGGGTGLGSGHPAVQREFPTLVGRRRSDRPHRTWRCGRPRSTAPGSCWSTRCTRPHRSRRWSRHRTCRPHADSSTRCTCGWRRSPSSPTSGTAVESARRRHTCRGAPHRAEQIDRDSAWKAKRAALESCVPRRAVRRPGDRLPGVPAREGRSLDDFATWCALAEHYGGDWHQWPEELQHPRSEAVGGIRRRARARGGLPPLACSGWSTSS